MPSTLTTRATRSSEPSDQADARQHGKARQPRRRIGLLDVRSTPTLPTTVAAVGALRPAAREKQQVADLHAGNVVADRLGRRRQIEGEILHSLLGAHGFSLVTSRSPTTAASTIGAADAGQERRHFAEGEPDQGRGERRLERADQRRARGGDQPRADGEQKQAEAELQSCRTRRDRRNSSPWRSPDRPAARRRARTGRPTGTRPAACRRRDGGGSRPSWPRSGSSSASARKSPNRRPEPKAALTVTTTPSERHAAGRQGGPAFALAGPQPGEPGGHERRRGVDDQHVGHRGLAQRIDEADGGRRRAAGGEEPRPGRSGGRRRRPRRPAARRRSRR